jgi:hypothetical protein
MTRNYKGVSCGLDPVGNRLSASSSLYGVNSPGFSYGADDQILGETCEANGNTKQTGGKTFAYDSDNHLFSMNAAAVTMVYDGDGNRVAHRPTPAQPTFGAPGSPHSKQKTPFSPEFQCSWPPALPQSTVGNPISEPAPPNPGRQSHFGIRPTHVGAPGSPHSKQKTPSPSAMSTDLIPRPSRK